MKSGQIRIEKLNLLKKSDLNEIISSGEDVMLGSFHESVFKAMIRGYGEKI